MAIKVSLNAIPTLSSEGWVTNIDQRIDRILAYMLVSDASQSTFFQGSVNSVQAILQRYGGEEVDLQDAIRELLRRAFERSFERSSVDVRVRERSPGSNELIVEFYIEVSDKGETRNVGASAEYINGVFQRINDINEGRL